MKTLIISLILILFPFTANALNTSFFINSSLLYVNSDSVDYVNEYETIKNPKDNLNFSLGANIELDNKFNVAISTNRIYSPYSSRTILYKGNTFELKNRTTIDTIAVGKRFKRILPMVFVSSVNEERRLVKDHKLINRYDNSSFVYGVNLTAFLNKKVSGSVFCAFPSGDLNYAIGLGINYYF